MTSISVLIFPSMSRILYMKSATSPVVFIWAILSCLQNSCKWIFLTSLFFLLVFTRIFQALLQTSNSQTCLKPITRLCCWDNVGTNDLVFSLSSKFWPPPHLLSCSHLKYKIHIVWHLICQELKKISRKYNILIKVVFTINDKNITMLDNSFSFHIKTFLLWYLFEGI